MKTTHVIYRFLPDYKDDLGSEAAESDCERYDELIAEMLPEWASWCGDEIIADIDHDADDLDMDEIMRAAFEKLCSE